jgi:diguanylate cyclase (GGDEF)-like protein
VQSNSPFAIASVDLDRFKEVNDCFGHAAGDALLRLFAQRLLSGVEGAFCARLGGDEFMLIVTNGAQPAAASVVAERLLDTVEKPFEIGGDHIRVGISIGIAIFPTDGTNETVLLGNADAALYRAKHDGRGLIRFFDAETDERVRQNAALRHDLRDAIENNQLILHYQPQARIDGEIFGFEALARWDHPVRGIIPPNAFIPVAEESGLIIPLGKWILREACREAASWPRPLPIAINLSPVQFRYGDLPGLVHSVLLETGLNPARVELEITESVLLSDFQQVVSILRRLKALGVRIAMADFGTGYSSLAYLQSFPFDKIKIARAFVSDLERNRQSVAIIRAIIGLVHGLEVPVIAEGVETADQMSVLSRETCNQCQGYYIGRPGPIDQYAELIGRSRPADAADDDRRGRRASG